MWRNGLNHHTKRNEEWHDDMHMYGSQLPRRLLPKETTHEHTHTNRYTPPAKDRWEALSYRVATRRCPVAPLAQPWNQCQTHVQGLGGVAWHWRRLGIGIGLCIGHGPWHPPLFHHNRFGKKKDKISRRKIENCLIKRFRRNGRKSDFN